MTDDTHNTPLPVPTHEREAKAAKAALAGLQKRMDGIRDVIDGVELRCQAVDGPMSKCRDEITDDELRQIYRLATGRRR